MEFKESDTYKTKIIINPPTTDIIDLKYDKDIPTIDDNVQVGYNRRSRDNILDHSDSYKKSDSNINNYKNYYDFFNDSNNSCSSKTSESNEMLQFHQNPSSKLDSSRVNKNISNDYRNVEDFDDIDDKDYEYNTNEIKTSLKEGKITQNISYKKLISWQLTSESIKENNENDINNKNDISNHTINPPTNDIRENFDNINIDSTKMKKLQAFVSETNRDNAQIQSNLLLSPLSHFSNSFSLEKANLKEDNEYNYHLNEDFYRKNIKEVDNDSNIKQLYLNSTSKVSNNNNCSCINKNSTEEIINLVNINEIDSNYDISSSNNLDFTNIDKTRTQKSYERITNSSNIDTNKTCNMNSTSHASLENNKNSSKRTSDFSDSNYNENKNIIKEKNCYNYQAIQNAPKINILETIRNTRKEKAINTNNYNIRNNSSNKFIMNVQDNRNNQNKCFLENEGNKASTQSYFNENRDINYNNYINSNITSEFKSNCYNYNKLSKVVEYDYQYKNIKNSANNFNNADNENNKSNDNRNSSSNFNIIINSSNASNKSKFITSKTNLVVSNNECIHNFNINSNSENIYNKADKIVYNFKNNSSDGVKQIDFYNSNNSYNLENLNKLINNFEYKRNNGKNCSIDGQSYQDINEKSITEIEEQLSDIDKLSSKFNSNQEHCKLNSNSIKLNHNNELNINLNKQSLEEISLLDSKELLNLAYTKKGSQVIQLLLEQNKHITEYICCNTPGKNKANTRKKSLNEVYITSMIQKLLLVVLELLENQFSSFVFQKLILFLNLDQRIQILKNSQSRILFLSTHKTANRCIKELIANITTNKEEVIIMSMIFKAKEKIFFDMANNEYGFYVALEILNKFSSEGLISLIERIIPYIDFLIINRYGVNIFKKITVIIKEKIDKGNNNELAFYNQLKSQLLLSLTVNIDKIVFFKYGYYGVIHLIDLYGIQDCGGFINTLISDIDKYCVSSFSYKIIKKIVNYCNDVTKYFILKDILSNVTDFDKVMEYKLGLKLIRYCISSLEKNDLILFKLVLDGNYKNSISNTSNTINIYHININGITHYYQNNSDINNYIRAGLDNCNFINHLMKKQFNISFNNLSVLRNLISTILNDSRNSFNELL